MTEEMDYGTRVLCPGGLGLGTVLYETSPHISVAYQDGAPVLTVTAKYVIRIDAGGRDTEFVRPELYVVEPGWSMS